KQQSANRKKARKHLAKAYLKVQRQREDFARKQASALVSSHDLIAYEHLQIANMVKNRTLAKSIHDAAWGQFLRWMNYYAAMHGMECQVTTSSSSRASTRHLSHAAWPRSRP